MPQSGRTVGVAVAGRRQLGMKRQRLVGARRHQQNRFQTGLAEPVRAVPAPYQESAHSVSWFFEANGTGSGHCSRASFIFLLGRAKQPAVRQEGCRISPSTVSHPQARRSRESLLPGRGRMTPTVFRSLQVGGAGPEKTWDPLLVASDRMLQAKGTLQNS
jgi:hypothetical protein